MGLFSNDKKKEEKLRKQKVEEQQKASIAFVAKMLEDYDYEKAQTMKGIHDFYFGIEPCILELKAFEESGEKLLDMPERVYKLVDDFDFYKRSDEQQLLYDWRSTVGDRLYDCTDKEFALSAIQTACMEFLSGTSEDRLSEATHRIFRNIIEDFQREVNDSFK